MTGISGAARQVLQAQNESNQQQINTAVLRKSMDAQQQVGDAINQLLEQAVEVQRQISEGFLDVRV